MLTQQIEQGTAELDYLESVLAALSEAENERDLAQLREELTQSGVLSAKQTRNKKLRGKPVRPSRSIIVRATDLTCLREKTTCRTIF